MSGFHLSKWYVDCVADDGTVVVGYWARLEWRSLRLCYSSALISTTSRPVVQRSSIRPAAAPAIGGTGCVWTCAPLGLNGSWQRTAAPFRRTLLRSPRGVLRWSCLQPAANVELTVTADARLPTGIQLTGRGYVEKLELTIPPWRLPFNELFWGRFVGNAHSLVWLQWRDTRSARAGRRFAILDGDLHTRTTITSDAVRLSEAGAELHMPQWRSLREGALVETVFGAVPGLTRVLPARFLRIHESKRLSRCELHLPDEAGANGWAIHEVVRW